MYQARRTALGRMTAQCAALGGHGVVGVRLSRGSYPSAGWISRPSAPRCARPARPAGHGAFTCGMSGQEFAKLIMAGWVPVGLALGLSIGSPHDDRTTARQARWVSGNVKVADWTELVNQSRHDARRRLEDDVRRLGAEGVVSPACRCGCARDCPAAGRKRTHTAVDCSPSRVTRTAMKRAARRTLDSTGEQTWRRSPEEKPRPCRGTGQPTPDCGLKAVPGRPGGGGRMIRRVARPGRIIRGCGH